MIEGPRLAALVASRVCHDMAEPLNALIQGLEMLKDQDTNGKNADAISLMEHGVNKAWAKLEFFRFAFASGGAAGGDGDAQIADARPTAEKLYGALKPTLVWDAGPFVMPRAALKVLMNALLIANECLPKGGTVTLATDPTADQGPEVRIICEGVRVGFRAVTLAALRGELPEDGYLAPIVQPLLTGILARQAGVELAGREGEGRVEIVLRSPHFQV
jgi:histidine phosphotransferase ChpT